ncbi:HAD hydrolase-like protein [Sporosarcina sp. Te-1]|nr:HAD hydrolase-like protein [Sporosarcina sp. Te-1]
MDGTLFQTDLILEQSLDDTFAHLRSLGAWEGETPIATYRNIMGVPLPKVWAALLPDHSEKIKELADSHFLKRLIDNIENGKGALYPNVKEVFLYLKEKGVAIFIASNGLPDYLTAIIRFYGLDEWVSETFSIQQIQSLDKSGLVKMILEKYAIQTAVVVGDRLSDIKAAKDNGLLAIGCRFDFAKDDELVQADWVIDNLLEIKSILT